MSDNLEQKLAEIEDGRYVEEPVQKLAMVLRALRIAVETLADCGVCETCRNKVSEIERCLRVDP